MKYFPDTRYIVIRFIIANSVTVKCAGFRQMNMIVFSFHHFQIHSLMAK